MNAKEVCEYITDLDKKYQQACFDVQEAWEIFQDILRDDAAVKGEGWLVPKDRIDAWVKKVPVMSSSRCARTVFKIDPEVEEATDPHAEYLANRQLDKAVLPLTEHEMAAAATYLQGTFTDTMQAAIRDIFARKEGKDAFIYKSESEWRTALLFNGIATPDQLERQLGKCKVEPDAGLDTETHDKHVWCVFAYISVPQNVQDYDVLKGIFDTKEKAITRQKELERRNKSNYTCFDIERMGVE